jgi:hypothetical protein
LKQHHPEDEESDYDDDNRAVPEVSFEEFSRDPMATWRKFRRQAERPGHISSHRSAFRRLPQYLRPTALDQAEQGMRQQEWEEEQAEQYLSNLLLENRDAYAEKLDAWLPAQGEGNAAEEDALLQNAHASPHRAAGPGGWGGDHDVEMAGARGGVQRQRVGSQRRAGSRLGATEAESLQGDDDDDSDMKNLKRLTAGIAQSVRGGDDVGDGGAEK